MSPRTDTAPTAASPTVIRTVCSYCGVGCGLTVSTAPGPAGLRVDRAGGDREHPTNRGRLCTKGASHVELMSAPGRRTAAAIRPSRHDAPVEVAMEKAISDAGARLRRIIDEHGPDAVALYVSGQMSLEAQYLANKLVKGHLRGIHIESNSRLCMASAGSGYKQSLGADGPPGSYEDLDAADLFFVIGSNMADCHPILFLRMADRLKQGAKLIVVDPRRTATAERADLFLQIRPGTDLALLNGLLHLLVAEEAVDHEFIAVHTEGWAQLLDLLGDYPPAHVAEVTGLEERDLRTAARWIAEAGEWMTLWTMGLNQSTQGTWHTNAICNLHLATGTICRPGSGPFSLTGQPNAMGGREMGYMGPGLPGQRTVLDPDDRAFVENAWGLEAGTLRAESGPGTVDMFRGMAAGDIRAAWIICTNPVASMANRATVVEGLETAELVIVQDAFADTATSAYADVLLPAALWVESEGVTVGSDRTMNLVRGVTDPPGDALPDWMLICRIAQAMGFERGFDFRTAEQVFDEIRTFWNPQTGWDIRGVSYDRLREGPVQWPAPPGDTESRHPIRYLNDGVSQRLFTDADGLVPPLAFPTPSGRARFIARPHLGPHELPDDDYPWVLNTGRLQHQWHTMTKTGRIPKLMKLAPAPFVEIHPDDAAALAIADGNAVEIDSRRGRVVLPAVVTDRVQPGNCFAPFHWNDVHGEELAVNAVTTDVVDPVSLQPELKHAAVSLRRVERVGAEPRGGEDAAGGGGELADLVGVSAPTLTRTEEAYIAGFLQVIERRPLPDVPAGVPTTAPLSEPVRAWVGGILAGLGARDGTVVPARDPIPVLWGSQTGTAEEIAVAASSALASRGIPARALSMADVSASELAALQTVLVVTSTFGDGGPPDNAARLWGQLTAADMPRLDGLAYAVFAIGDPSYEDFCGHGRGLDRRLDALGASPLLPRVDCEPEYADPAAAWVDRLIEQLLAGTDAPALTPTVEASETRRLFTRANPLHADLVTNTVLSGPGSAKEVRRLGFDLAASGVAYEAGDALGVMCSNPPAVVAEWLDATGLPARTVVELDGHECFLRDALPRLDITRITPAMLAFIADRNADHALATLLRRENAARLEQHLWRMQAVDLLREFPVAAEPQEWVDALARLQPRHYSISSSPKEDPDEVQLTVSVVRFETDSGARRGGVCSTFLADGVAAPIFLRRSSFRPPAAPDARMIMVGPGTGVAPFRGFLHDRRADGHTGENWLFFGEQHEASDFYYREELEGMRDDGFLTRLDVAFSRDQRQKVYVQDRMREHGLELWRWLEDGAHFLVCGDASRMAKDVEDALTAVIRRHGGLSEADASAYVQGLASTGRYRRDVY